MSFPALRLLLPLLVALTGTTPLRAAEAVPPPRYGEPLVATEAGIVAFTGHGILFSTDRHEFVRTARPQVSTLLAARPVAGGAVAFTQDDHLLHTNARGQLSFPLFVSSLPIADLASDGQAAIAIARGNQAYRWVRDREWSTEFVGDNTSFFKITHGLGRFWIAGAISTGEDESDAALWSSGDGREWQRVTLPAFVSAKPAGEIDLPPSRFVQIAAVPGCVLAVDPFDKGVVSRDGKSWRRVQLPRFPGPVESQHYRAEGNRLVRETISGGRVAEALASVDGERWIRYEAGHAWHAARAIPGPGGLQQIVAKAGDPALIVTAEQFRDPGRVLAEQEQRRAALAAAAAEKARAEAEAKRLAEQRIAAAKAKAESDAAAAKAAAEKQAVAKREAAGRARASAYANLKRDLARQKLVLSHLRLLDKFTTAHGQLTPTEAAELVPLLLKEFSGAKAYLLSISSSDELMRSILRALTPEQKAAMQEVAKAAGSRTSLGKPVRAPVIDLSRITSASTALFDVAYMSPRASYRATSDTSYIGAAYDMALACAEGAGVAKDANLARNHMHLADREGIRPPPASGTGGSAALKGPGGVDLIAAARYGSTVAANLYANELLKQGKSTPALEWLRAAALKTHYNSRLALASYVLGEGDLRAGTIEEAFRWLEAGARAGHPDSMGLLGYAIMHGLGVEPDPTAARPYLEAGARLGSKSSKQILDSLNAWEKDRAAAWEAVAQESRVSNEILNRLGKGMEKAAQDLQAANKSLAGVKQAPGAAAQSRADLRAKGMTEAQIDAHLAEVDKAKSAAPAPRPPDKK